MRGPLSRLELALRNTAGLKLGEITGVSAFFPCAEQFR